VRLPYDPADAEWARRKAVALLRAACEMAYFEGDERAIRASMFKAEVNEALTEADKGGLPRFAALVSATAEWGGFAVGLLAADSERDLTEFLGRAADLWLRAGDEPD